ncbi:MAG TPA: hypothetical protein VFY02_08950 [Gaiellaceae bacterium]|jgi:hypothetical protein|nr:hypothetical protein [Gaiellaceae bacterium]
MLTCDECGCRSRDGRSWRAYLEHPDDPEYGQQVATYCPPCAAREYGSGDAGADYI